MTSFTRRALKAFFSLVLFTFSSSIFAQVDNRPGSVLAFPYYTSNADASADTLITIANPSNIQVEVHLYFIERGFCQQGDIPFSLTPNATITMKMSEMDPMSSGYLIAVAQDLNGNVTPAACISGNAFIKAPAGYLFSGAGEIRGDYGATGFKALSSFSPVDGILELNFDGIKLEKLPRMFAAELQNPTVAPGQTIVIGGLVGDVSTGAISGAAANGVGQLFNANEDARSFSAFIRGTCHSISVFTATAPRVTVVGGINNFIIAGTVGIMKFPTAGGAGILITPRNNAGWSGIRTLTYVSTTNGKLLVPAF